MSFKIYQVGGSVRDELLGQTTKDHDFVVCLDDIRNKTVDQGWAEMRDYLFNAGYKIFLETKDAFTIRARFPDDHEFSHMVADFVMARSETGYDRGKSRMPHVELGTLYEDLLRRDFTVNAIAKDENGKLYDFFEGQKHLKEKKLYTPIDPAITFLDDPLRVLRAMRFVITKGFTVCQPIINAISDPKLVEYFSVVSDDRIREELTKCFKHNTGNTIIALCNGLREMNKGLYHHIFQRDIWLKPTNEAK